MYHEFQTKPQSVDFSLDSKKFSNVDHEYNDILSVSCSPLKWICSAEIKDWGINGISVYLPDQEVEVNLTVEFWSDSLDEGYERDITVKLNLTDIELSRDINHINCITIEGVELEIKELKKIDDNNYVASGSAVVDFTHNDEY